MTEEEIKHREDSYTEVAARDFASHLYELADAEDSELEEKEK